MIQHPNIPLPTLKRYSIYLNCLQNDYVGDWVSTSVLGERTGNKPITVRKDLSYLCVKGQPQKGYPKKSIISGLKFILGGESCHDLILIGSWGFAAVYKKNPKLLIGNYKLRVCFDYIDEEDKTGPIPIYPMDRLKDLIPRLGVSMALLSVEPDRVIEVSEELFLYGIKGILNLTPQDIPTDKNNKVVNFNPLHGLSDLLGLIHS